MEIWKDVIGYEGLYQVSNTGKVKALKKVVVIGNARRHQEEKILLEEVTYKDYRRIALSSGGNTKRFLIHRLVGIHFIDNPLNKKWINHKDMDKSNNNDWNLEWSTSRENTHHYRSTIKRDLPLGVKNGKSNKYVASITVNGKGIGLGTFKTPEEACMAYQAALANTIDAL